MGILYSALSNGFYDTEIHGDAVPADAVAIAGELHQKLLDGQTSGKVICADKKGLPILKEPAPPTIEELSAQARGRRNRSLSKTDSIVSRHRDEVEEGSITTLSSDQYKELQSFRKALRDWPSTDKFPSDIERPVAPDWLD